MQNSNVVPIRQRRVPNDSFMPPKMTVLRTLRKHMGLTIEEAASALYIPVSSLAHEESCGYPPRLNDLDAVRMCYLFFLSVHGNARPRNLLKNRYSLCDVRINVFMFDLATMGSVYGGHTARQWYLFEVHECILDRTILEQIENDVRELDRTYRYL
jgi:transcriptional regulator with XRE-family HTH domain